MYGDLLGQKPARTRGSRAGMVVRPRSSAAGAGARTPPPQRRAGELSAARISRGVGHLPGAQKQPAPRARPDTHRRSCP